MPKALDRRCPRRSASAGLFGQVKGPVLIPWRLMSAEGELIGAFWEEAGRTYHCAGWRCSHLV